jgi:hypothetical protein
VGSSVVVVVSGTVVVVVGLVVVGLVGLVVVGLVGAPVVWPFPGTQAEKATTNDSSSAASPRALSAAGFPDRSRSARGATSVVIILSKQLLAARRPYG